MWDLTVLIPDHSLSIYSVNWSEQIMFNVVCTAFNCWFILPQSSSGAVLNTGYVKALLVLNPRQ